MKTIDEKIQEIKDQFALEEVHTTTGMNGYPENTDSAWICDSKNDLIEAAEKLKDVGCEVDELWMAKKDGQYLWNRSTGAFILMDLKQVGDQDYYFTVDTNQSESDQKNEIYENMFAHYFEDHFEIDFELIEKTQEQVNSLYTDIMPYEGEGEVYAFYDGVNGHNGNVDYVISDETTGYHDGDVTSVQMGLSYTIPEDHETKEFIEAAEQILSDYVDECVESGGISEEWRNASYFEEFIENEDFIRSTDRVEVSSPVSNDTRFSVYYDSNFMMLKVVDTSA